MKQNDSCRQEIRIEKDDKDDKNDIFTLSEEEFNSYFNQLQTSNIDLLNKIMNFFSRHYYSNKFEYNEQTHLILTVAVANLINEENQNTYLAKNSFNLISNAIKNSISGLTFIITTGILKVLKDNIFNLDSPFYVKAIISITRIMHSSQCICGMIYKEFTIFFFMKNSDINNMDPDIPVHIFWILFYFTKYGFLTDKESYEMIDFLNNYLDLFYQKSVNQNEIKSYEYEIYFRCIKILTLIFNKSAQFTENEVCGKSKLFFNFVLQQNANTLNKKFVSGVLQAYIPLLKKGSALKDPSINIEIIVSLINSCYPNIQHLSLDCLDLFIRSNPISIKMLLQTDMLTNLQMIFKNASFKAKKKSLSILNLIMKHGTNEDKTFLLNPSFVIYLVFLAKEADDISYLVTIELLNAMLMMENVLSHDYQIHSSFLETDGIQIIEEISLNGSEDVYEASQLFLKTHFPDT